MYESFRNEFMSQINWLNNDDLKKVLTILDTISNKYKIVKKEEIEFKKEDILSVLNTYLVTKRMEGLSESTLSSYNLILKNFFNWANKPTSQIQTNDIRTYLIQYQNSHKIQLGTLDKYREYICRFFAWAKNEGYLENDPSFNIRPIKHEKKQRKALTQIELEQLRDACKTPRETVILELFYSTGCRVSELCNLKLEDINWQEGTVHLYGKGKKHRTSYLNPRAILALKKYLEDRTDDCSAVIITERAPKRPLKKEAMELAFKKIVDRAFGPEHDKITPHVIRHTTATTALQRGMPITDISTLLGHESINTTMVYAEISDESVKTNHTKCII